MSEIKDEPTIQQLIGKYLGIPATWIEGVSVVEDARGRRTLATIELNVSPEYLRSVISLHFRRTWEDRDEKISYVCPSCNRHTRRKIKEPMPQKCPHCKDETGVVKTNGD